MAVFYSQCEGFDLSAIQSSGAPAGGVGTIFTQDKDEAFGHLNFNNRGLSHNSAIPTVLVIETNCFDRLSCNGNARVNLTVVEPLTLAELAATGGIIDFTGAVYGSTFAVTNTGWTHSGTFGFTTLVELAGTSILRHGLGFEPGLLIQPKNGSWIRKQNT